MEVYALQALIALLVLKIMWDTIAIKADVRRLLKAQEREEGLGGGSGKRPPDEARK